MKIWRMSILMALSACLFAFTACNNNDNAASNASSAAASDTLSMPNDANSTLTSDLDDLTSSTPADQASSASSIPDTPSSGAAGSTTANLPVSTDLVGVKINEEALSVLTNKTIGWGQGKDVDDANRPTSSLLFQNKYQKYDAYFIGSDEKKLYLTFDEGYENGYTATILDVLKQKSCPAVFYVTMPYVKQNPKLIQRMIDEGHMVGNHTVTHPSMPSISITQCAKEISDLHQEVYHSFQYQMTFLRPPKGEFSERTLSLTKQLGYKTMLWSFAYLDWDVNKQPSPTQALKKMTDSAHDGAIYLLHAVSKTNAAVLGDFIDQMRAAGYTFSMM